MNVKPSIPKGTRDMLPETMLRREFITQKVKGVFKKYGFLPIETPAMENLSTLTGKYGEEGDRLIFKILESGDFLKKPQSKHKGTENLIYFILHFEKVLYKFFREKVLNKKSFKDEWLDELQKKDSVYAAYARNGKLYKDIIENNSLIIRDFYGNLLVIKDLEGGFDFEFYRFFRAELIPKLSDCIKNNQELRTFADINSSELISEISQKALRYDLTVPFARFVVQNQHQLQFPFKRYQIQPVWRADRPQKGRFREFYQCDADVVGSTSLLLELDFINIYREVFKQLGINVSIKINNRKVLYGLAESLGIVDRLTDFTIALDKLDKVGVDGVVEVLEKKGFSSEVVASFKKIATLDGTNSAQIAEVEKMLSNSEAGKKGIEELQFIFNNVVENTPLRFDVTLARGLDYYTGAIFEVVADDVQMGSIGGGGRYDDLTGIFGMKGLSGIGISFGLDRIYLVMEELQLFPAMEDEGIELMFVNFGDTEALEALKLANALREIDVHTEVYPDAVKLKKQMDYANKKNIKYVLMMGTEEIKLGKYTLKNMHDGNQQSLSKIELLEYFNNKHNNTNYGH